MRKRGLIRFFCLVALGGCAQTELPGPVLEEVCLEPAEDSCTSRTHAGAQARVWLLGHHFLPVFEVDLGDDEAVPSRGEFRAWLGGERAQAEIVTNGPVREMEALVVQLPPRLGIGLHDAEIQCPDGRQARLEQSLRITDPLEVHLLPQARRFPAGHLLGLAVVLDNVGSAPVDGIGIELTQEGEGHLVLPDPVDPFDMPGMASRSVAFELTADGAGPLTLSVSASGTVNQAVPVGPVEPLSVELVVLDPARLSANVLVDPAEVGVGENLVITASVRCNGETPAHDVSLLSMDMQGTGEVSWDPRPTESVDIPAGYARDLHWTGRADAAGEVELSVVISGRESITDRELGPLSTDPVSLVIH